MDVPAEFPDVEPTTEEWRAYWRLCLYESAGEAGGSFRTLFGTRRGGETRPPDVERPAAEAARRARAKIRRYCAANRLNRLGTLTYAGDGCHEPRLLRTDVAAFFRSLRGALGGERFAYLWVPEWHPGGHGLHVHFAVGRYIGQKLIRHTWGHGHVDIRILGDLPVGSGALEEARLAARYLGKYAAKAVDAERPAGLHRYEVAQGFQPEFVEITGATADEAIGRAATRMQAQPSHVWRSSREDGWQGPPACWVAWSS